MNGDVTATTGLAVKKVNISRPCYQNPDKFSPTRKDLSSGAPCYQNPDKLSPTRKDILLGAFRVLYKPRIFFSLKHRETTIIDGLSRCHHKNLFILGFLFIRFISIFKSSEYKETIIHIFHSFLHGDTVVSDNLILLFLFFDFFGFHKKYMNLTYRYLHYFSFNN